MLSIIVPIYKVETYLPQCIESVLNQSYSDFELILVDDGSPDKSGMICDEYANKDNRIHVIHKKNGGVSDARNTGLSLSKGKYIWFLDSDDYMAKSSMQSIADTILRNNYPDIITCAHINEYSDGKTELALLPYNFSVTNKNEYLHKLYQSNGAYWDSWKNIFRRSIIEKNDLQFLKSLVCAEDCDFFMRFVNYGENFSFVNYPVVHYRINREGSVTNNMSKSAIMSELSVFKNYYYMFGKDYDYKNHDMKVFFANKFANTISILHYLKDTTDINEVTYYIQQHKEILNDVKGIKYCVAKLIWLLFGYYNGSKMIQSISRRINN